MLVLQQQNDVVAAASIHRRLAMRQWTHATIKSTSFLVDGADFFNYNKKQPERWAELSSDRSRYARATQSKDGSFFLQVYERSDTSWRDWEGPSIVPSLEEAQTLGRKLLQQTSSLEK